MLTNEHLENIKKRSAEIAAMFPHSVFAEETNELVGYILILFAALEQQSTPRQLTLDELREMDGLPVWTIGTESPNFAEWSIVSAEYDGVVNNASCIAGFNSYNAKRFGWIAYDKPPNNARA